MDNLMMYNYLKDRNAGGMMDDSDFISKFKRFMNKYRRNSMRDDDFMDDDSFYMRRHNDPDDFPDMFDEKHRRGFGRRNMGRMRDSLNDDHFTESEAKYIVADMYHVENGSRYSGEKYDMHKAKEICERFRGILPQGVRATDIYVAINSQYHDYAELFKNWFGGNIDQKIIESAIVFWFKDVDSKLENKVVEYFREY